MNITTDSEFRKRLLAKIAEREFHEREGVHQSDLVYCLPIGTRVLAANLHWLPLETVSVGQALVGLDEELPGKNKRRRLRKAIVTGVQRRTALTYKIKFVGGHEVRSTAEHMWLSQTPSYSNGKWRRTEQLKPGFRIRGLTMPWKEDTSYEAGYVPGGYDGEGNQYKGAMYFSQKPNAMFYRVQAYLEEHKYPYRVDDSTSGVCKLVTSSIAHMLRFLGSIRPPRFINKEGWWGVTPSTRNEPQFIISAIEPWKEEEVIGIETDIHTYNAEGLWSHNCLNKQALRRLHPKPIEDHELLLFSLGWSTQRWLTGADKDIAEKEVDGITVTCDALEEGVPWELKASYQSNTKTMQENPHWIRQCMAQCKVMGTTTAYLSRLEIMGNWKWVFKPKTPEAIAKVVLEFGENWEKHPTLTAWKLEFTQPEIDSLWDWLKMRQAMFIAILETGELLPKALALAPGADYECNYCSYKSECKEKGC